MYRMSIIDQEIEELWGLFQLARQSLQPDSARLLLKTGLLYLHVRGLQSSIRLPDDAHIKPFDLEEETEKTWGVLRLGARYGNPGMERDLFKKSLYRIFFKGLRDGRRYMSGK
jgi:hypothetical protein